MPLVAAGSGAILVSGDQMSRLADAHHFAQLARDAGDLEILSTLIGDLAHEMGFRHFILGHHFDSTAAIPNAVVIQKDRKSVVSGKRASDRVDDGVRGIYTKKTL